MRLTPIAEMLVNFRRIKYWPILFFSALEATIHLLRHHTMIENLTASKRHGMQSKHGNNLGELVIADVIFWSLLQPQRKCPAREAASTQWCNLRSIGSLFTQWLKMHAYKADVRTIDRPPSMT